MLAADKPEETEMAELFLREAILMKDFHHVHVLGVIGVSFDSDGSPMVILPYMANGDLRQYITRAQLVRFSSYRWRHILKGCRTNFYFGVPVLRLPTHPFCEAETL